jgi:hypothetical protein
MAIITPQGTLMMYGATLFVPARNKFDPTKDPRYEASLILSKAVQQTAEYKAVRAEIASAAKAKFGDKMQDRAFVARLKLPIKEYFKGEEGDVILKAWTKEAPPIVDPMNKYITVKGDVWSGQLARFEVNPWAFDTNGSVGVTLFLNSVQITKLKMPRLDGRKPADKVFSKIEDEAGGGNAGDGDDDLPF